MQVLAARELYGAAVARTAELEASNAELAKQLAESHDQRRTQQAAALRLLSAARACVSVSRGAQDRAGMQHAQLTETIVAVRIGRLAHVRAAVFPTPGTRRNTSSV